MSDQVTSGEPNPAPETAAPGAATPAAPTGDTRPIGSFGNARGSGLARGKRPTPPAAASAASPASSNSYKPTSVAVLTPQREYTNPFATETTPVTASTATETPAPAPSVSAPPTENLNAPVASASEPPAVTAPAVGEPDSPPPEVIQPSVEKAEIKILPPAEAKRPSVSWGESHDAQESRPAREPRPTFQPERREPRKFEPREPRDPREAREPRDPREAREPRRFEQREPRREGGGSNEPRPSYSRPDRDAPRAQPAAPAKSGGFIGWLKGLFGAKPADVQPSTAATPDRENRDGEFQRRRHRGGRGRGGGGGYQGDNRGPREGQQPRDGAQGGPQNFQGGDPSTNQGERRFEGGGGGGRRRRRGGRGRYRDDRGPRPEGQQGGGAI